ncbi:MAG: tetratricopeptide repeat protein [Thiolinea sp.]
MSLKFRHLILLLTLAFCAAHAAVDNNKAPKDADLIGISTPKSPADSQFSVNQQKRLDMLFTRLAGSEDENAAKRLIAEIWSIWKDPLDTELLLQMTQAEQFYVRGKRKESFAILDEAIKTYPGYSEVWNQRATYYYFAGRYEESLADIAKVLELEPRHFGALSGKIAILMRENRMESALKTLHQALKINPFMPERRMLLKKKEESEEKPEGLAI